MFSFNGKDFADWNATEIAKATVSNTNYKDVKDQPVDIKIIDVAGAQTPSTFNGNKFVISESTTSSSSVDYKNLLKTQDSYFKKTYEVDNNNLTMNDTMFADSNLNNIGFTSTYDTAAQGQQFFGFQMNIKQDYYPKYKEMYETWTYWQTNFTS